MPFYSDEIIDEVRNANDIVDVIGDYVELKKKGASYFGLCPFHNEKSASFSVSRQKQMYYCFGCGAGGNVITFLRNYENMTFPEALKSLADRAGIALPEKKMSPEEQKRADRRSQLLSVYKDTATWYYKLLRSEAGADALAYFRKRELSEETMQKFGLGYSPKRAGMLYSYLKSKGYSDDILMESRLIREDDSGKKYDFFWNRAMFPIMDANTRVIAFGGRVMGDGEPKYLNSSESMIFDKSRTLYGLYLARKTRRKEFILCEGYMDVIALHQAGFDNAVATLGTALTSGHAAVIKRYTNEVYLSYDSDGAGVKAALRAIPILREEGITCKVINMQPHKDPDEFIKALGKDAYEERIEKAENSFMFTIRMMERDYNLNDPEENTNFWHEVGKRILGFPEELERRNYEEAVCHHYQMDIRILDEVINRLAAEGYQQKSRPPQEETKPVRPKKRSMNPTVGFLEAQRLFLTRLCEAPDTYSKLKEYVVADYFTEGLYRDVASLVFQQIETTGAVDAAGITEKFPDDEMQRELAAIFNTTGDTQIAKLSANVSVEESESDQRKMMWEVVLRLLREHLRVMEQHAAETGEGYSEIIEEKKKLQDLEQKKSL